MELNEERMDCRLMDLDVGDMNEFMNGLKSCDDGLETSGVKVSFISQIFEKYYFLMEYHRDKRADNFPLMSSVWPTLMICISYIIIVKWAGPRLMKDRNPLNIKGWMLLYNIFQTLFSLWGFIQGWKFYVSGSYSWTCEPVDYSTNPEALRALNMAWWFYISKFIDLLDSIFFILTKKFSHLTFLHVFHHGIMPFQTWWGARFVGGGHGGFAAFFNSGVHTVMYLYYLLAACGPKVSKYLWWKRYLTSLQMIQFVFVFLHAVQPLYLDCDYPKLVPKVLIANALIFFFLFSNFYFFAYIKKKKLN
ncbi:elongation of very long chain fatty acids protein AAEL008004 [Eurytemora carolleeae]|uniref:elongation of very long chain fatty acids protein AAEL008004 n=1 Tax=Eurytemora carolleeae TaxID=1294199 RepID=UPI000C78802D|nr:elongation of very long chain fatty acids protein AAEL008004 [Eurytemora carolleeae]|eukprot:XP_023340169.1 elongation of very long chain fatty acids protein AAEL008004-like [Eurytemora affinis]